MPSARGCTQQEQDHSCSHSHRGLTGENMATSEKLLWHVPLSMTHTVCGCVHLENSSDQPLIARSALSRRGRKSSTFRSSAVWPPHPPLFAQLVQDRHTRHAVSDKFLHDRQEQ